MGYLRALEKEILLWSRSLVLSILLVAAVQVHVQSPNTEEGFISIDCSATVNSTDSVTGIPYTTDDQFIETGVNYNVSSNYIRSSLPKQYSTVRSFPEGNRNCYSFKIANQDNSYLLRASFMYGNYDGKNSVQNNSPLLFNLYIGMNLWATVNISEPLKTELNYRDNNLILLMRRNLGASSTNIIRYPDDPYDRIWEPMNITVDVLATDKTIERNKSDELDVPSVVLQTASVSAGVNDNIRFYWDSPCSDASYYVILHFSELELLSAKDVREFNVSISGSNSRANYTPAYLKQGSVSETTLHDALPHAFILNASKRATRPPLLNAFEILLYRRYE